MTTKTDAELKEDVGRELAWETRVDETAIGVSASGGIVTLNGTVSTWAEKQAAEQAAHRVAGVLDVANEIEIKPSWNTTRSDADVARAVRAALQWDSLVPDRGIRSTVSDHGAVTLTGTVRTLAEREEAENLVKRVAGVRHLINQIAIDAPCVAPHALHAAIKAALERHVAREVDRISIDVHGDTVVLTGAVGSWLERRAALGAAKGTLGVKHVDDQLRIE
ncbi:MAG TPA: BON domain-containing protein [Kofleriaceae bacterium]|nr:BON domain-containing protein [Kofleriaceae bacterium]